MLGIRGTHYCFVNKISKIGQVGQSESDDFFAGEKAKKYGNGHHFCFSYFNGKIKNDDLITTGSLTFSIQIKMPSDLLCPYLTYFAPPDSFCPIP